jgi:hypothetical protein
LERASTPTSQTLNTKPVWHLALQPQHLSLQPADAPQVRGHAAAGLGLLFSRVRRMHGVRLRCWEGAGRRLGVVSAAVSACCWAILLAVARLQCDAMRGVLQCVFPPYFFSSLCSFSECCCWPSAHACCLQHCTSSCCTCLPPPLSHRCYTPVTPLLHPCHTAIANQRSTSPPPPAALVPKPWLATRYQLYVCRLAVPQNPSTLNPKPQISPSASQCSDATLLQFGCRVFLHSPSHRYRTHVCTHVTLPSAPPPPPPPPPRSSCAFCGGAASRSACASPSTCAA